MPMITTRRLVSGSHYSKLVKESNNQGYINDGGLTEYRNEQSWTFADHIEDGVKQRSRLAER